MKCPHCNSSNRSDDSNCYSCEKPLHLHGMGGSSNDEYASDADSTIAAGSGDLLTFFIAVCLTTAFGAGLGMGVQVSEIEAPFFLEEVVLGTVCALATAFSIGKFKGMHEGLLFKRLAPAAGFGALVGLCLYWIWWYFDPSAGFVVIGGIGGFCSALPIAVSFGLLGGESRPLGGLEFMNVGASILLGGVLGIFLTEDFYGAVGFAGLCGLIPCFVGGRINLYEMLSYFED